MAKLSKRELFSIDITKLDKFIHDKGYGLTKGEGYRTAEQQYIHRKGIRWDKDLDTLVETGKPRSKVKVSQHQKRLAEDKYLWNGPVEITDAQWIEVGEYWESLSSENRWGGRYGVKKKDYKIKIGWDRWHFERRG